MNEPMELVLGEPEPESRLTGVRPTLAGWFRTLVVLSSFGLVGLVALESSWISAPPALVAVGALVSWAGVLLAVGVLLGLRQRPSGRFAFGEQIEVSLIEGWLALLSWGEVLSYRERGRGIELHTTRPPPRPNKAGILPDLPQTLWVPTRDEAERARLLRLLRAKKIPRQG